MCSQNLMNNMQSRGFPKSIMLFGIVSHEIRKQLQLNAVGICPWRFIIHQWQQLFYTSHCPFVLLFVFYFCHILFLLVISFILSGSLSCHILCEFQRIGYIQILS